MSLKKLGGETAIYGLSNVLGRLLNFIAVTPLLTRVTANEEYGVIGVLFMWIGILTALLVFRMDTVVFRYASRAKNDSRAVFKTAQTFVTAVVVVVIGLALYFNNGIATWMDYPDRNSYITLFLITVAFDSLSAVPQARLRLERRPWFFVVVNLGNVVVNLLLIYLLLIYWPEAGTLFGMVYDDRFLIAYYLFTIAAAAAFRYVLLLVDGLLRYGVSGDGEKALVGESTHLPSLGTMLKYSLPLTLVAVAGIFNALSGPWIIKWFYGSTTTGNLNFSGLFNAALKMAVFLNLFVTAYNYAAEPYFFRQAGSDLAKADRKIYADATRAYALLAAVSCAGILIFLPWLQLFLDPPDREGLFILPYLLAGNFCLGLYSNFSIAYKLTDNTYLGGGHRLTGKPHLFRDRKPIHRAIWPDRASHGDAGLLRDHVRTCLAGYEEGLSGQLPAIPHPDLRGRVRTIRLRGAGPGGRVCG